MMRSLALSAGAVFAVALGLSLAAVSHGGGPHGGPRLERAVEALDLDAQTRARALAVIDGARPASRELREGIRTAHGELRALLERPEVSEEAVLAKADAIGALRSELQKHELRTLMQVRAQLPAEQAAKLGESMRSKGHWSRGCRAHEKEQ